MLLDREYKAGIIDAAIARAKAVLRVEALKKVVKPRTTNRQVLVMRYDPRLPSVNQIVRKHHRTMIQDPYMAFQILLSEPIQGPKTSGIGSSRQKFHQMPDQKE